MLITQENRVKLNNLLNTIKLHNTGDKISKDKEAKIEQIIAYMEIIHSVLKKYSAKRPITLIDSAAGNCYLSFLVYYFYKELEPKNVTIHCIDTNERLMNNARKRAKELGFTAMHFHASDILDFTTTDKVQLIYSLHACNSATDKTLYLGLKLKASNILSVSCCQHTIKKQLKKHPLTGITKHKVYKDRITYMVGDSLRALLLESRGYQTDIIEFVSSRYTDKNIMIRAVKSNLTNVQKVTEEYHLLQSQFNVQVHLAQYLQPKYS